MKKFFFFLVIASILTGCSSIAQLDEQSNNAEIERLQLTDSSSIYFINWKGHIYIYSPDQHRITEVYPIK